MHHTAEARSTALGAFLCVMPPGDETAVVSRDDINHLKLPDGHLPLFIHFAPEIDAVACAVQRVFPARDIVLLGKRLSNGSGPAALIAPAQWSRTTRLQIVFS